jgi:flagellar basal-body rod modification protein FlgD
MSTTTNLIGNSTATSPDSTATSNQPVLSEDDFLTLLIAQLKNQDPLNPMSGSDFAAQLAQFSTVQELTEINSQFATLTQAMTTLGNAQMTNLIGTQVTANENTTVVNGSTSTLSYNLPSAVQQGTVSIYNPSGSLVQTLNIGSQSAGNNTLTWNSSNLPAGNYTFNVSATDSNGQPVTASTTTTGTVTGVSYQNGTQYVTVNGQSIPFSSVVSIAIPGESSGN